MQFRRQLLGQRLHLALNARIQVAAAVRAELQGALQLARHLQGDLPGPVIDLRQLQTATQGQRPVALWRQLTADLQLQVVTLQGQALQIDALLVPVADQLQLRQLRLPVQAQLTQTDISELQAQGQLQARQAQRRVARLARRHAQRGLLEIHAVEAQGQAQQAGR